MKPPLIDYWDRQHLRRFPEDSLSERIRLTIAKARFKREIGREIYRIVKPVLDFIPIKK